MIKPNKSKKPVIKFSMYWAYALIIAFLVAMLYIDDNSLSKEVSYSKFEQYVASGGVKKIIVTTNKNTAEAVLNDSLARKVFHESQYKSGSNQTAKIITDIPSADKLQEKSTSGSKKANSAAKSSSRKAATSPDCSGRSAR